VSTQRRTKYGFELCGIVLPILNSNRLSNKTANAFLLSGELEITQVGTFFTETRGWSRDEVAVLINCGVLIFIV